MSGLTDPHRAAAWLLTPEAVRQRCNAMLDLGRQDLLPNFSVDLSRLPAAAAYVAQVMRENYPTLAIPYHARWRHFSAGGVDRWGAMAASLGALDSQEIARIRFDLCVVSVLLDAGAGPDWRYHERESGQTIARSEGLGVASFHAFRAGSFSGNKRHPLRADAKGLREVSTETIATAFQTTLQNPLVGIEGRAALMRNLGAALAERPDLFGVEARVGALYDHLLAQRVDGRLAASAVLAAILDGLGPIWPGRIALGGRSLGDVWRHASLKTDDLTSGLVPFHKLSQWLTYSLIEIFEDAGVPVSGLDALTGLPEYRNGGLFLDLGVLALKDEALAAQPLAADHEAIVEWRALTVALLDAIAEEVRDIFQTSAAEMPLARILEGGTWAAGRKIAREKRPGGGPPLTVVSDGTVF